MHCNIFLQTSGVLVPASSVTLGVPHVQWLRPGSSSSGCKTGMSNTEECGSLHLSPWAWQMMCWHCSGHMLHPTGRNKPSVARPVWAPVSVNLLLLYSLTKVSESLLPWEKFYFIYTSSPHWPCLLRVRPFPVVITVRWQEFYFPF